VSAPSSPSSQQCWLDEIALGLSWRPDEVVVMVWIYYDESGEYARDGTLTRMTVGGCIAPLEKWRAFEPEWRAVLAKEGLEFFHMADFEAWRPPFDFKLQNGDRDKEKHNRLLSGLLEVMLDRIEGLYGFAGNSVIREDDNLHKKLLEDSISGAIKNAIVETWTFYEKPLTLVFDSQSHFPKNGIEEYIGYYDFSGGKGRVKSVIFGRARECPALQAADIIAYEMAKVQRMDRPQRYPFSKLIEGARARNLLMHLVFGPIRTANVRS
jgi:hypothetical protein